MVSANALVCGDYLMARVVMLDAGPLGSDAALDADVILVAQAHSLIARGDAVSVATTNVKHLSLFVDAREWQQITA
jgi:hypothetical protein